MHSFGLRRRRLTLLLAAAVAAPASLAAQAGDWELHPLHPGSSTSDWTSLTVYVGDQSNTSLPVPVSRLRGLTSALIDGADTTLVFSIPSAAGTVSFTGRAGHGSGSGEYRFAVNRAFSDTLEAHGVRGHTSSFDLFRLALRDVKLADVDALVAALRRYDGELPDAGEYIRLMNHDVDAGVLAEFGDAGLRRLDAEQLIRLTNHDVNGTFVKWARANGHADLDVEGLIRLKERKGEFRPAREARIHRSY